MKKHQFLKLEYHSTVYFTPSEQRQLKKWLDLACPVVEFLFKKKIISAKYAKSVQVSLLICGDARIKELNLKHRYKNKVTDVLSFPALENLRTEAFRDSILILGDVAICHPQTKRQAKKFEIGYWDEFIHLFFHGLIHLMGFDHEMGKKEEELMEKWEQEALKEFSRLKKMAKKKGR